MVGLDLRGFIASNAVARERLRELIERYGSETVKTVMEELIRYSERRIRERLRELPDGVFRTRGFLDHDGFENRVYRTDIRLEKDVDVLRFDMRDCSPQAGTYINCTEGALTRGGDLRRHRAAARRRRPLEPRHPQRARGDRAEGADRQRRATGGDRSRDDRSGLDGDERGQPRRSKLLAFSDELRRHSCAVTHGTFAALFSGDRNQYGEPYGTQLLDAQIGGVV